MSKRGRKSKVWIIIWLRRWTAKTEKEENVRMGEGVKDRQPEKNGTRGWRRNTSNKIGVEGAEHRQGQWERGKEREKELEK